MRSRGFVIFGCVLAVLLLFDAVAFAATGPVLTIRTRDMQLVDGAKLEGTKNIYGSASDFGGGSSITTRSDVRVYSLSEDGQGYGVMIVESERIAKGRTEWRAVTGGDSIKVAGYRFKAFYGVLEDTENGFIPLVNSIVPEGADIIELEGQFVIVLVWKASSKIMARVAIVADRDHLMKFVKQGEEDQVREALRALAEESLTSVD